jgi:hypothetical protein
MKRDVRCSLAVDRKSTAPLHMSTKPVILKERFALSDIIPITLTRTYRPNDSWSRPFGIGATHPYEMFIGGNGQGMFVTPWLDLGYQTVIEFISLT